MSSGLLVVEDDAATRVLLRVLLRREGLTAEFAADQSAALARLAEHAFAAVLIDLRDDASARAIIERLETTTPPTPAIVCTESVSQWNAVVVKTVLRRPLQLDALHAALKPLVDTTAAIRTILIVDHDVAARRVLRSFLEDAGVIEASTLDEARTALRRDPPDLILLDIGFAGELETSIPVVILSARPLANEERERLLRHADAILEKAHLSPKTLHETIAAIRRR